MTHSNICGNSNSTPARSHGRKMYVERLNMHFVAASVLNEKESAVLFTSISSEVYKLLLGLCFPHVPTEVTFDKLTQLLNGHFQA